MSLACFGFTGSATGRAFDSATSILFAGWATFVVKDANGDIRIHGDYSSEEEELVRSIAALSSRDRSVPKLYGYESLQGYLTSEGDVYGLVRTRSSSSSLSYEPHRYCQNVKDVASCGRSADHLTAAIDATTGQLWQWTSSMPTPRRVTTLLPTTATTTTTAAVRFTRIWAGEAHFLSLAEDGTLYSWGSGRHSQLGHGDLVSEPEPKSIESLQGIRIIDATCGASFNFALSEAGDVYGFGLNDHGQLGLGHPSSHSLNGVRRNTAYPQLVDFYDDSQEELIEVHVVKVVCGGSHAVVLDDQGNAWGCGWAKHGQLGRITGRSADGTSEQIDQYRFVKLSLGPWTDIACGLWTTFLQRD
ncbi:hypothetical protein BGZ98_010406 [Dissophora globulifera]|nr:hypothetical protein BGZ98_010406 [Dissophora globulifera]